MQFLTQKHKFCSSAQNSVGHRKLWVLVITVTMEKRGNRHIHHNHVYKRQPHKGHYLYI